MSDQEKHTRGVLREVHIERERQDKLFGEQNHKDWKDSSRAGPFMALLEAREEYDEDERTGQMNWTSILAEEVLEAFTAESEKELREELIQVAAVAVAWIECLDRRGE